ncbi:MAG TPA: S8 family serine peptidase, partial [bacterium]|nr:S8 family serine peptidase [bacterium]
VGQIVGGDIQSWSGSGPHANGSLGVNITANGAWGPGSVPINEYRNGWGAWETWGGTSRSCPLAAGIAALVYEAYQQKHGVLPTPQTVKDILMNSAVDQKQDVFRQGSGRINAGRAVQLASENSGVEVTPSQWIPGDYRGEAYDFYARLVYGGDIRTITHTIQNHSDQPVTLNVSTVGLEEIGYRDFEIQTVASPLEEMNSKKPDYIRLLESDVEKNIPANTDLIVLEAIFPFEDFDTDFNGNANSVTPPRENAYQLLVYNWTDINQNGKLFDDSLGSVPNLVEANEIESGEFTRMDYGYNNGTQLKCAIADPLRRMGDGIWFGIRHRAGSKGYSTTLQVRVRFYAQVACPWLSASVDQVVVPANGQANPQAQVEIPMNMAGGFYSAKLLLQDASGQTETTVIPVQICVAADLDSNVVTFGGGGTDTTPYSNNVVRGDFSWQGRDEAGDGRFFCVDAVHPSPGDQIIVRTEWQDSLPTDIDTIVAGPASDSFSNPLSSFYDPSFGPGGLEWVAGASSPGRPTCTFYTATGSTVDYACGALKDGLHGIFLHNVLFSGKNFAVPFSTQVSTFNTAPSEFHLPVGDVTATVSLMSATDMTDFRVHAYGPSLLEKFRDQPVERWNRDDPMSKAWVYDFTVQNGGLLDFRLSSGEPDLDLYLFKDGWDGSAPDGQFDFYNEKVIASETSLSSEFIWWRIPPNGFYRIAVVGYALSSNSGLFDLDATVVQGTLTSVLPTSFAELKDRVTASLALGLSLPNAGQYGVFMLNGPAEAQYLIPTLLTINAGAWGDLDGDGEITLRDLVQASIYWGRSAPANVDADDDGIMTAIDLLEFIRSLK